MGIFKGWRNSKIVDAYERVQDRRLEAWYAFEDQRWDEAAAGFEAVIEDLKRLRRVPVNVDIDEDIAEASELRDEALSKARST
jgi:hypothetical protein